MTPIVVVAYNRPKSLHRLLTSLANARYKTNDIPLIISIDKADNNQDVLTIANEFEWRFGEKTVCYQPENLKLRRHILRCGDYALEYGRAIILEDDLYVSRDYYNYAVDALDFASNDNRIGGISLYSHRYNGNVYEPFEPMPDSYDNWYIQFAASWGEAWTKEQWIKFRKWYEENQDKDLQADNIPVAVTNWSSSSWLKYFIKYLIETDKYFLYPRETLTTNFSDAGTHVSSDNTSYQVPLRDSDESFYFSTLEQSKAVYDAFFENTKLNENVGVSKQDIQIDLYGIKPETDVRYLLTPRICDYKILKGFSRSMRPHDANVVYNISGEDFFLYDKSVVQKNEHKYDDIRRVKYNIRIFRGKVYKTLFMMFFEEVREFVKKRLKK